MNYNITIIKAEANPNFEAELKEFNEQQKYDRYNNPRNYDGAPQKEVIKNVLTCHLTEEQFKKVKAEVFKVFE
jgi:hypothetical protein